MKNWIEQVESRPFLLIAGFLLLALATLLVTSLRNPVAYDAFWHLQMGKDLIENGLSPWVDHYSFTFLGEEISNPPVFFQVLLHFFVSLFGVQAGFTILKLVCFSSILFAALVLLRQMKAPVIVFMIVLPAIVYMLQLRAYVRPELISYLFAVLALMLYFRAGNTVNWRTVLPITILMLAWTNYHRTSIVGYVIFSGFFLDCAVEMLRARAPAMHWARWFVWGALLLALGFLNPAISHPLVEAFTFSPEWKNLILEYQHNAKIFRQAGMYAIVIMTVISLALAFKQRRFGYLLIQTVLIYAAFDVARMVTFSGIVITFLTVKMLQEDGFPRRWKSAGRNAEMSAAVFSITVISLCLMSNVGKVYEFMRENKETLTRYPLALTEYMATSNMAGRVFNSYGVGGYLIYRLSHQNQVYIDGRTHILYPIQHMQHHNGLVDSADALRSELRQYDIDKIVWSYSQEGHDVVHELGDFGLEFMDAYHALYLRGSARFTLLGKLMWQPACWQPAMLQALQAERRDMDGILPYYSRLYPFADFALGFAKATNGTAWFDASIAREPWSDEMRRFAGFRFLEAGFPDIAIVLMGGVEKRRPQDLLVAAMAMLVTGDHQLAGQVLAEFAVTPWAFIGEQDLQIYLRLYTELEKYQSLNPSELGTIEHIRNNMLNENIPGVDSPFDSTLFCPAAWASGN